MQKRLGIAGFGLGKNKLSCTEIARHNFRNMSGEGDVLAVFSDTVIDVLTIFVCRPVCCRQKGFSDVVFAS